MKTKLKAFKELTNSGKKLSYRNKILKFVIERDGANMYEIESLLRIKHETASARISELQDMGLIYVEHTYKSNTRSSWSFEPDIQKQKNNRLGRLKTKREAWYKNGIENGWLEDNICII